MEWWMDDGIVDRWIWKYRIKIMSSIVFPLFYCVVPSYSKAEKNLFWGRPAPWSFNLHGTWKRERFLSSWKTKNNLTFVYILHIFSCFCTDAHPQNYVFFFFYKIVQNFLFFLSSGDKLFVTLAIRQFLSWRLRFGLIRWRISLSRAGRWLSCFLGFESCGRSGLRNWLAGKMILLWTWRH